MSELQPQALEKSEAPHLTTKQRYSFVSVALALIIGFGLCTVGFLRLSEMADAMVDVDEIYAIPPFAAGLYFLLLAVVLSAMHPRPPAPRLRLPRTVLFVALPACTFIATAIVYISTRPYNHAVLGFWDSLGADGAVVWSLLAFHSIWLIALCIFAWSLPVIQHRRKSHLSSPVEASQARAPERTPATDSAS